MAYKKIMAAAFAVTLFLAGCAGSTDKGTSQAAVPLKETMNPISVCQLVAADNEHNRTIMFQLLKSVEAFVEYREKGNDRIFSVSAKGAALKGNNGITDSYIYTAELTDLKKGTAYEYRTRTGNTVSGWMDFRTDDGGALTVPRHRPERGVCKREDPVFFLPESVTYGVSAPMQKGSLQSCPFCIPGMNSTSNRREGEIHQVSLYTFP